MSKKAEKNETVKLANFEEVPPDQLEAAELMKHQELIYEASRYVDETENALRIATDKVTSAKEREKGAKADHDDAVAALQQTIRNCRANKHLDLPLFAGPKPASDDELDGCDDDGGTDGEVMANGRNDNGALIDLDTDESWRDEPLAGLPGFKPKTVVALTDAGIYTMGQLADFTSKASLGTVKGIGTAAVEEIGNATAKFWEDRKIAAEYAKAVEVASIRAVEIFDVIALTQGEVAETDNLAIDLKSASIETVADVIDFFATAEQAQSGETIRDIGFIADAQVETLRVALIEWRKSRGKVAMELLPDRWLAPFDDVAAIAKGENPGGITLAGVDESAFEPEQESPGGIETEDDPLGVDADLEDHFARLPTTLEQAAADAIESFGGETSDEPPAELVKGFGLHPESTDKKRKIRAKKAPSGSV